MTEPQDPPADQSWLEMEGVKPSYLTFSAKLTEEQVADFRERFEAARLRPVSLLSGGMVIRRLPWWSRLWRKMRGRS